MSTKVCSKCEQEKELSDFAKDKDCLEGYRGCCKLCRKEYQREWCAENRERLNENSRQWTMNNQDKKRASALKYYYKNKDKHTEYSRQWQKNNPEKVKVKMKRYRLRHSLIPSYRLTNNIRNGINKSLHRNKKGYHWESIVGYTIKELMRHIEKQFTKGMSWANYGKWHIDHVLPVSFFEFKTFNDTEFKMCWRLENLQPLWAIDNLRKNAEVKYVGA